MKFLFLLLLLALLCACRSEEESVYIPETVKIIETATVGSNKTTVKEKIVTDGVDLYVVAGDLLGPSGNGSGYAPQIDVWPSISFVKK